MMHGRTFYRLCAMICLVLAWAGTARAASPYFEVRAVDSATSHGVPLVELETVNGVRTVTDSAGRAAILEPSLEGLRVYFKVTSHGYEYPKDGFGFPGFVTELRAGGKKQIALKRVNIAERLYRVTGEGIYRDSVMLGYPAPLRRPLLDGQVFGQDSVTAIPYRGKLYWFWGDTMRPSYPLGHFRMAGATSLLPGAGGLDPAVGVDLDYFTGPDGFSRPMVPLPEAKTGAVWIYGLAVVPDAAGRDVLGGHYGVYKDLGTVLEQGMVRYNDEKQIFEKVRGLDIKEKWRFTDNQPVLVKEGGRDYLLTPKPFPVVRVRAAWEALIDPAAYEAFTCLRPGAAFAGAKSKVERDKAGRVVWGWKPGCDPLSQDQEAELVKAGRLGDGEVRFQLRDAATDKPVHLHFGTFYYNDYLKAWVMIGVESGGTSFLGEVWFAQSPAPTGPWRKAVKIVTHDRYSFYNPVQHPMFTQQGGRIVYFEGTYASTFSGAPCPTPRYDYNQVMYRLDLADPRLKAAR